MDLYGIAIAALPDKDNGNLLTVTCTPIAVASNDIDHFKPVDSLKFEMPIDLKKPETVFACFEKTTKTIDAVVKLQKKSLGKLPYRPVALKVGHAAARPVEYEVLHTLLFGHPFKAIESDDALKLRYFNRIFRDRPNYTKLEQVPVADRENPFTEPNSKTYFNRLTKERDDYARKIHNAQAERAAFLAKPGNGIALKRAQQTAGKMARLMDDCTMQWGSYLRNEPPTVQSLLDIRLQTLEPRFRAGDKAAHAEIVALAKEFGHAHGIEETDGLVGFALTAHQGYQNNPDLQELFPSRGFLHWDPAFAKAFHEGFEEGYTGPVYARLKLPLNKPNPFFTDPVAHMVCEQHQILARQRAETSIDDSPTLRRKLATSGRRAAKPDADLGEPKHVPLILEGKNEPWRGIVNNLKAFAGKSANASPETEPYR